MLDGSDEQADVWWFPHKRAVLLSIATLYLAVGLVAAVIYQDAINPDGISYLEIAEQYAHGEWGNAVNGYWGPLLSWLLVPPLVANVEPQLAFRLLNVVIGGLTVLGVWRLTKRLCLSGLLEAITVTLAGGLVLAWSVSVVTPDLLVACILTWLSLVMLNPAILWSPGIAAVSGLLGACAYLAKPFAFLFFVAAFLSAIAFHAWTTHRRPNIKNVLANSLIGYGAFLIMATPWILLIGNKYGHLSISTSGAYNLALVQPNATTHPHYVSGLLPPPYDGAPGEWVDPSSSPFLRWNPSSSTSDALHLLRNFISNQLEVGGFLLPLLAVIGIYWVISIQRGNLPDGLSSPVTLLLVLSTLYIGLYCLILIEPRYLWPVALLLLVACARLLADLVKQVSWTQATTLRILTLGAAWVFLVPVWTPDALIGFRGISAIMPTNAVYGTAIREGAESLQSVWTDGNIASNDAWADSYYLAYFLGSSYYGMPQPDSTDEQIRDALETHDISWYFHWGRATPIPSFLSGYELAFTLFEGNLRVFRLAH